jgi:hypothetical protein
MIQNQEDKVNVRRERIANPGSKKICILIWADGKKGISRIAQPRIYIPQNNGLYLINTEHW